MYSLHVSACTLLDYCIIYIILYMCHSVAYIYKIWHSWRNNQTNLMTKSVLILVNDGSSSNQLTIYDSPKQSIFKMSLSWRHYWSFVYSSGTIHWMLIQLLWVSLMDLKIKRITRYIHVHGLLCWVGTKAFEQAETEFMSTIDVLNTRLQFNVAAHSFPVDFRLPFCLLFHYLWLSNAYGNQHAKKPL